MARIDKEKLAFEVEKYVFLYDKSNAQYKNRNATDQAWAAIASELGIDRLVQFVSWWTRKFSKADKPAR